VFVTSAVAATSSRKPWHGCWHRLCRIVRIIGLLAFSAQLFINIIGLLAFSAHRHCCIVRIIGLLAMHKCVLERKLCTTASQTAIGTIITTTKFNELATTSSQRAPATSRGGTAVFAASLLSARARHPVYASRVYTQYGQAWMDRP